MNRAPSFLHRFLQLGMTFAAGVWLTLHAMGADTPATFDAANHALAAGRAAEALRLYERLVQSGGTSAAIERNWALACQQTGLNAQALLHLRRAVQLAPRDADVLADLRALRTRLGAATGSESRDASWIRVLSVDTWGWAALALMWMTVGVGITRTLRPGLREKLTGALVGGTAATSLAILLTAVAYLDFQSQPNAIVLQGDTILRQSPIDEARPAFTAPAAAELRVRDTRPGWVMGEDPASGRFGWVPQKQLGFVIP